MSVSIRGWYQLAFEQDLKQPLSLATLGEHPIALVRSATGLRAFDARCPHRGANLTCGGKLEADWIVCPFHGYRVGLSSPGSFGFQAQEYHCIVRHGAVLVRMTDTEENGLCAALNAYNGYHSISALQLLLHAPADLVVENGFDAAHFRTVHGINNEPDLTVLPSVSGELAVRGTFNIQNFEEPAKPRMEAVPYWARAFSPGLVIATLEGSLSYAIMTGATPSGPDRCVVRLTLLIPPSSDGAPLDVDRCMGIIRGSEAGLEKDRVIWESLAAQPPARYTPRDAPVIAFREFCKRFQREDTG